MNKQTKQAGKYLTFKLEREEYAIPITKVKEIIGMISITAVPQSQEYIKGVINLRGSVIPVIDLRLRFDMEAADYTERTCIVIVEILKDTGLTFIGLVVDTVSEVIFIEDDQIDNSINLGGHLQNSFITGMAKTNHSVKILLDIGRMVNGEDILELREAA